MRSSLTKRFEAKAKAKAEKKARQLAQPDLDGVTVTELSPEQAEMLKAAFAEANALQARGGSSAGDDCPSCKALGQPKGHLPCVRRAIVCRGGERCRVSVPSHREARELLQMERPLLVPGSAAWQAFG